MALSPEPSFCLTDLCAYGAEAALVISVSYVVKNSFRQRVFARENPNSPLRSLRLIFRIQLSRLIAPALRHGANPGELILQLRPRPQLMECRSNKILRRHVFDRRHFVIQISGHLLLA